MFLWVRLVLDSIDSAYTPEELRQTVASLPSDLADLYGRIMHRICGSGNNLRSTKAIAILRWIAFAQRPIKLNELLHGLVHVPGELHPDIQSVPVPKVLDICKPSVEQHPDGTVSFVHFSVQE